MGNCSFKHDDETGIINGLQAPIQGKTLKVTHEFRTNQ